MPECASILMKSSDDSGKRPMSQLQVYGIPTCSTCKKALKWLDAQGVTYTFINTKLQPPTTNQVQDWVVALGYASLRNTSGQSYRALGPEKAGWTDQEWITAYSQDAMLLKRPLFVQGGQAVAVGFRDSETLATVLGLK